MESKCRHAKGYFTSQKNSFPRRPQNQEIQLTSSELLMLLFLLKFPDLSYNLNQSNNKKIKISQAGGVS